MSESPSGEPHSAASAEGPGILAGLPRTRPQRASARRAASARANRPSEVPLTHAGRSRPAEDSVPAQGYESEGETLNRPIQPPGGAELVASLAELAGELARAGVNTSARALRDILSRLPG